jgi:hypothetical protein
MQLDHTPARRAPDTKLNAGAGVRAAAFAKLVAQGALKANATANAAATMLAMQGALKADAVSAG